MVYSLGEMITMTGVIGGLSLGMIFLTTWRQERRRDYEFRMKQLMIGEERREKEEREREWKRYEREKKEEDASLRSSSGVGTGGYIILELPEEQRPFFHDLLHGFEEYAKLKGYSVSFSIDATFNERIAFKFTLKDEAFNVGPERVRRDFQEYIEKVKTGESLDDLPVVTSIEEHELLVTVLKNRISFLQHSYHLTKNAADFYEALAKKAVGMPILPSQNIILQTGGAMDSRSYNATNSTKLIQGDQNKLIESSTNSSINISGSFNERKTQIENIQKVIDRIHTSEPDSEEKSKTILNLEKVKDELENETKPDESRVGKWLERAKQAVQLGSFGHETVTAVKDLLESFGIAQ